jgi:U4/U6.U5 tri-snRNP component SNU23
MSGKATASGGAGVGPNRRKWDLEEYSEKARERDREEKERAQENEERIRKGQKPLQRKRRQDDLPKPTETLKARENDLEIEKNQGKTLMVDGAQGGRKGPGFYCEICNRTYKDSIAYLDHVNGRQREFARSKLKFQKRISS